MDAIDATRKFAQPELLTSSTESVPNIPFATTVIPGTSTVIAPFPLALAAVAGQRVTCHDGPAGVHQSPGPPEPA